MKIEYGPPAQGGVTQLMSVSGWETKFVFTPAALIGLFVIGAVLYEVTMVDPTPKKRRRR